MQIINNHVFYRLKKHDIENPKSSFYKTKKYCNFITKRAQSTFDFSI